MADCPKCAGPLEEDVIDLQGTQAFRQQCQDCQYVDLQVIA